MSFTNLKNKNINIKELLSESQFNELKELNDELHTALKLLNQTTPYKVTFYGGARLGRETKTFKEIQTIAYEFAKRGWGVATGGGPGVMTAALEGAKEGGGQTISFKIHISQEAATVPGDVEYMFDYFPPRKYALRQSAVYVYCPGGIGTLDELYENLDLLKTDRLPHRKIYLYDSKFWSGLDTWMRETVIKERGLADKNLPDLYKIVDTPEEIIQDMFDEQKSELE